MYRFINQTQLLVLFALLLCGNTSLVFAQKYRLEVSNSTYTEIKNPTYEIPGNSQYFGNVTTKPEMEFRSFGNIYNLNENIFIPLKQGYAYFINQSRSTTIYAAEGLFKARNPAASTIFSFVTDTSQGGKIFIAQWKNMGFENGDADNFINFQLWLYERTGVIKIHFGTSSTKNGIWENGANGPTIGLLEMDASFSTIYNQLWLGGNSENPMLVNTNSIVNLHNVPINGQVYTFFPLTSGLSELNSINTRIYPNPTSDKIFIESNKPIEVVSLYDALGREVYHGFSVHEIDVKELEKGIYFLRINDGFTRKVIIN